MVKRSSTAGVHHGNVDGLVKLVGGKPAAGVDVRAIAQELRTQRELGRTATDETGRYSVQYQLTSKDVWDLQVQVLHTDGTVLASSALLPSAPTHATINLVVDQAVPGPSEYERLLNAIEPRLGKTTLAELTPEDVQHLATVTHEDPRKIQRLADSARCSQALGGDAESSLPASLCFALFGQGLPVQPGLLLRLPREVIASALARVAAEGIFEPARDSSRRAAAAKPTRRAHSSNAVVAVASGQKDLHQSVIEFMVRQRAKLELTPAVDGQPLTVADLFHAPARRRGPTAALAPAELSVKKQGVLAELVATHGSLAGVKPEVLASHGFSDIEISTVGRLSALAELTGHHKPAVHALNAAVRLRGIAQDGSLASLAHLQSEDWEGIVASTGAPASVAGETESDRSAAYAAALEHGVESRCRTAVLAARIRQGRVAVPASAAPGVLRFFDSRPGFEFGKDWVLSALQDESDAPPPKAELMALDRTFRLTDNHRQQHALLAQGLDSAQKVARLDRRELQRRLSAHPGVDEQAAAAIHARAQQASLLAASLLLRHQGSAEQLPAVRRLDASPAAAMAAPGSPLRQIPDLQTLFGSMDSCTADPCRSVLSPAAYFVDLLKFLEGAKAILAVSQPPARAAPYRVVAGGTLALAVAGTCTRSPPEAFEVLVAGAGVPPTPLGVATDGRFSGQVSLAAGEHVLQFLLQPRGGSAPLCSVERTVRVNAA